MARAVAGFPRPVRLYPGGSLTQDEVTRSYTRFFPLLREKCRRMLIDNDEAQDVAQETLVRFWRAGVPTGDVRRVTAWLYRTSTHLAVDRLRRRSTQAPEDAAPPVEAPGLEAGAASRQLLSRLAAEVPADELEAAVLDRLDGLTQPEAAEVLGVSERTVRRLLSRFDARAAALQAEVAR